MKKKILFCLFALLTSLSSIFFVAAPAGAEPICQGGGHAFSITRWCEGVEEVQKFNTPDEMKNFILQIVTNVGMMIGDVGAYIAVIFVMYGGFLYMTSAGDPGKAASGKKTITNACIGIVITKVAKSIIKVVAEVAHLFGLDKSVGATAGEIAKEFLFWGGAICVIMIIWGGLLYVTSAGDPGKAAKARQTLLYALVGLVIMIFASVIVNFALTTFE